MLTVIAIQIQRRLHHRPVGRRQALREDGRALPQGAQHPGAPRRSSVQLELCPVWRHERAGDDGHRGAGAGAGDLLDR